VLALDAAGNRSTVASSSVTTADGIAPTAPTSVTAAGVTKNRIMFQWSGATDNVGVTRYNIFLNGAYSKTVTATQSEFLSLASSTAYSVRVQAVDAAGNRSPLSNTLTLTTLDGIAPSVPSGLASSQITKTGFRVTWNASTDNGTVTKYNVYRNGTYVQTVTGTSYTFSGFAVNLTHEITVLAIDDAGNRSAQSTALSVATTFVVDPTPPTAPTNVASSNITSTGVRISWTAATDNVAVTSYNLYRNGTYVKTVSGVTTTYSFSGLTAGTTNSITVRALDAEGNFTTSVALSVTTQP
jgi:chitodextrinase